MQHQSSSSVVESSVPILIGWPIDQETSRDLKLRDQWLVLGFSGPCLWVGSRCFACPLCETRFRWTDHHVSIGHCRFGCRCGDLLCRLPRAKPSNGIGDYHLLCCCCRYPWPVGLTLSSSRTQPSSHYGRTCLPWSTRSTSTMGARDHYRRPPCRPWLKAGAAFRS